MSINEIAKGQKIHYERTQIAISVLLIQNIFLNPLVLGDYFRGTMSISSWYPRSSFPFVIRNNGIACVKCTALRQGNGLTILM